ncbi:MAG: helix-hairpin-helix domain-containing protein [Halanaerobiales bacterium]
MAKVNINQAGIDELMSIKGVGADKAERIVEYRKKYGYYKKLEDLLKVKGIGNKYLDKIANDITIGNLVKITLNPADYNLAQLNEVHLVGEMNDWNPSDKSYQLHPEADGTWTGEFLLDKGTEYKFMYDSTDWEMEKHIGDQGMNIVV